MNTTNVSRIERLRLPTRLDAYDRAIATFTRDLEANPAHAFTWAAAAMAAAAMREVCMRVTRMAESGIAFDDVAESIRREALRGARWPEFSSSPTSTLMSTYTTQAWAELAEMVERVVEREA